MLRVTVLAVGKLKEDYLKKAAAEYIKRLGRFVSVSVVELAEGSVDNEGADILRRAKGRLVVFDVGGEAVCSQQFASRVEGWKMLGSEVTLVIGGSNGISNAVKNSAHETISFSRLTFPHQLFRVMLLEQLYRAQTISANITYHK